MNTGRLNTTGSDLRGRVLGKEKRKGLHCVLIRGGGPALLIRAFSRSDRTSLQEDGPRDSEQTLQAQE